MTFGYDASGQRLGYNDSVELGICYTLRGLFGQVLREYFELNGSWSWVKDHIWAGGELVATVEPSGIKHLHRDHLGSVRVETGSNGALLTTHSYWPFGEEMTVTSSSERYRFAGHERDQRTGYDYMHARYYAPMAGRFFSVNPGRDYDLSHPQSFNLYAYVRNNPVTATDPTGKYLVLGTNAARVRQLLVEALRRPGFRSVLCHLQADPRPFTVSVDSLPNKGKISDEIAVRLGRPLTFGLTTGTLVNGVLSLEPGATVTVDLQKTARFHGDETGLTTLGHELHHALAFATARDPGTALESMGLGDKLLFTNGLSLAEAFGKQLASEKPDLSKEQAEELLKNWLEDSKELTKVTSTANPATGQEQQR